MDDTGPDYCTTERPFFLRKKIPASHRARGGTPNERLKVGKNVEVKERVKGNLHNYVVAE